MKTWQKGLIGVVGLLIIGVVVLSLVGSNQANTNGLSAAQVASQATIVSGDDLSANFSTMVNKPIRISGQVSSLQDGQMLLFTGNEDGIYSGDTVYVNIIGNNPANIIDDDIVTVDGVVNGQTTYNTAIGGTNTVPMITVYASSIQFDKKGN